MSSKLRRPNKSERQAEVRRLLEAGAGETQASLVEALKGLGMQVTQATVSRDLEALGAIRQKTNSGLRYLMPRSGGQVFGGLTPAEIETQKRTVSDNVLWARASGNILVLKTPPGHAQVVAAALDGLSLEEIVGTIAGDDTVMIVISEEAAFLENKSSKNRDFSALEEALGVRISLT